MRQLLILLILSSWVSFSYAQDKPGTSFDGTIKGDPNVCQGTTKNMMTDKDVENMITQMLEKFGIRNRYIVMACSQIENCQATLYDHKPYILYNPEFLNKVKHLNFSNASLPGADDKDWETLTIIAHELGHHINNHLILPLPNATEIDMELEADQTAGFIIYLMGGTLRQAQSVYYNSNVSIEGNYLYPPRKQRLSAVAKGWIDAANKYPNTIRVTHANPSTENTNTVTDIDGNSYKTVKIGDQVWMAENLNVTHFRNGDLIQEEPKDTSSKTTLIAEGKKFENGEGKPLWWYYDHRFRQANGKKYGILYNWYAVNDPRGLAPTGWHIPSELEWTKLNGYLGGEDIAGTKMKSTSGFSSQPGGYRNDDGTFSDIGKTGYWWSSSESSTSNARYRFLDYRLSNIYRNDTNKTSGFSVRCVRD